jgi:Tfp pilus assembly protein PilN
MLQNLLSREHKKRLTQEYYLRFVTICALIFSVAIFAGLTALLPAYMEVVDELKLKESEQLTKEKDKQSNEELREEIAQNEKMLTFLEGELARTKLSKLLAELLAERPEGIYITGFSYTRDTKNVTLEGVATTRNLVVPFARSLEANSYFENVPVHIADLAKNNNLEFHLSIDVAETENREK